MTNRATFIGTISDPLKKDEGVSRMFTTTLEVQRFSGTIDRIPLRIPSTNVKERLEAGTKVIVEGKCQSFNKIVGGRSTLSITVFVYYISKVEDELHDINEVEMIGYICKKPIYRVTPRGRQIADLMIATIEVDNSNYIPCILWGRNATFAERLNVGSKLRLTGRFQSREYLKLIDKEVVTKTTREISVSGIELL